MMKNNSKRTARKIAKLEKKIQAASKRVDCTAARLYKQAKRFAKLKLQLSEHVTEITFTFDE